MMSVEEVGVLVQSNAKPSTEKRVMSRRKWVGWDRKGSARGEQLLMSPPQLR